MEYAKHVCIKILSKDNLWNMRKLLQIILLGIIISCSKDSKREFTCQLLDIEQAIENIESIQLSKYASSIRYIPLETSDSILIGDVSRFKMKKLNTDFYIYNDNRSTQKFNPVLCFKLNGKFSHQIGSVGRSMKEFLTISNFITDESKNEVIICDRDKLLAYDLNGNYLRSFDIFDGGLVSLNAYSINQNRYIYIQRKNFGSALNNEAYSGSDELIVTDSIGNILYKLPLGCHNVKTRMINNKTSVDTKVASLYKINNRIKVLNSRDTIFCIDLDNMSLIHDYYIDFGKYSAKILPIEEAFMECENFIAINVLFDKYDFPTWDKKYMIAKIIYDKKRKKISTLKYNDNLSKACFTNDLDGGINFYPTYIKDGKMYQLVNAIDFIEMAEKSTSAKMKEVAAQLTEDSNPVVVEVTLK